MSWAIWLTGPGGSGASARARAAAERLAAEGLRVEVLEHDEMRAFVTPRPTGTEVERDLVHRALVWVAKRLVDAGVGVIVDAPAPRREWRDLARVVIPAFAEVQLVGPPAPAPGVDYEDALAPEMTLDTSTEDVARSAARIAALVRTLGPVAGAPDAPAPRWAVWITGLPGSGKTTLALSVAEGLGRGGVAVEILDPAEARLFIGDTGDRTGLAEEVVHRTLVYAARRLTAAGVPVIVDATAPRREWRELARALIRHFAEVQLVCPEETCATRERAVRWRLDGCAFSQPPPWPGEAPDVVPGYEPSLRPDLTIHTDVEDQGTAGETVLLLARRLHHLCVEAGRTEWDRVGQS
jgi:adenylylsulfate kinase